MKREKQSKLLTVKIIILFAAVAASVVVMAIFLSSMQTRLYQDNYTQEMQVELDELPDLLAAADAEAQETTATFDQTYQSLADSIAYMAGHNAGFAATDAKMKEYRDLFGVDNVLLVQRDGTILAQAGETQADYSSSRFNRLRTVFDDGKPSEAVEIDLPDKDWLMRYYAARVDSDTMVVIEEDPAELREMTEANGSVRSVLENMNVGQSGFIFAVNALDFLIEYYPDENVIGSDIIYEGGDIADFETGLYSWMTIHGEQLYCDVSLIGNMYYVTAVPKSDMTTARNITVIVILIVFIAVMMLVVLYGIFTLRENERRGIDAADVCRAGPLCINKSMAKRASILSLIGFLLILVISFYMQTLFALSSKSVSNNDHVNDIVESLERTNTHISELTGQYGERYLPICQVLGYILDENPDLIDRADLQELADLLHIQNIFVYEATNGDLVATNSAYTNYALVADPDDPSYDFIKLIQGSTDYVVQEPMIDEISGNLWQYIGVPLHDEDGFINGIVQITIRPALLENLLAVTNLSSVLDGVEAGSDGFVFAVNKEDDTFAYLPVNENAIGESVYDHDLTWDELEGGYNDYLVLDGVKYYTASAETENYYIYLAGSAGELMNERLPLTLATGVSALICILVLFVLMIFESKKNIREDGEGEDPSDGREVRTEMPDGRQIRTDAAASRWMLGRVKWVEKSAWQKTVSVMRWFLIVLVIVICLAVVFQNQLFGSNSIFAYILGGSWEHGLNIFAITACVMFCCVAATIVALLRRLLQMLSGILSARGETICRLLRSFLRYGALIGMIFYCLYLVGVNVITLLASAGILALAVSLGAQSLVSDIISGLFVIFEGEFRVGDIIMVGDWRGTVLEIGIRTTKVEDSVQNVKVIRNSDISNVINMTKKLSFVSVNYAIEYNESLEHVESILAKELPEIAKRLPAIVKGPYYRGVTALSDSSVDLKITMQCLEQDRLQLERDFNREIRLLFDKYDINIPFPQVVINQPTVHKRASEYEKWLAKQFNEEQKTATKDMADSEQSGDK